MLHMHGNSIKDFVKRIEIMDGTKCSLYTGKYLNIAKTNFNIKAYDINTPIANKLDLCTQNAMLGRVL